MPFRSCAVLIKKRGDQLADTDNMNLGIANFVSHVRRHIQAARTVINNDLGF